MAQRNFRLEIYLHRRGAERERGERKRDLDDVISAPGEDQARTAAKARLEACGFTVLGVANGPKDTIVVRVVQGAPVKPALVSGGVR